MTDAKPFSTPMSPNDLLGKDEHEGNIDHTLYREMIGLLLYLTTSMLDVMYSVWLCARFQANPKETHLKVVKTILRYLRGTNDLCLLYPRGEDLNLIGYTDVDFAGNLVYWNSTSGMSQFLGPCLVSWGSNKQISVALFTTKDEYISATACCSQLQWLKQ
ncbi:uncharacterized protein [Phyllobates terribilis]|uniref:uncharacterized protein n=1 Tax=Phyllobates terribilis TaxID=111132 RepID=UPI003CCA969E